MLLSEEAIKEFRQMRLENIISMLDNIEEVAQQTSCKQEDILLLRRELLEKKSSVEWKLSSSAPLDEEEHDLLLMIDNGENDGDD
jgi:predicted metal-dependent hydrolase